ncbi:family 16 glycosylhydrolase [Metabacillus sp. HB246100]
MEKDRTLHNEHSNLLHYEVSKGEREGAVKIQADVESGDHLAVKISSYPLRIKAGDQVPTDRTVTNPYQSGSDITGVDSTINKYITLFLADEKDCILQAVMVTLTDDDITPHSWIEVWEDTFTEARIDESKWNFVDGGNGFGNEEWQYYTNREKNARIQNQQLILEAHEERYEGNRYTSAKLTTKGKASWTYGRFSIKAKLPEGQGIWPAIWMMPSDMETYSGWPACGEIDIMELIGHDMSTVHGTIHYGNPHTYTGEAYKLPKSEKFSDDFHVFTVEWEPGEFRWYVDDILFAKQTEWFTTSERTQAGKKYAPFDRDFYLQLNLAVGGKWPGYPDETTVFPQQMIIDYIKVYQKHTEV